MKRQNRYKSRLDKTQEIDLSRYLSSDDEEKREMEFRQMVDFYASLTDAALGKAVTI